jgi:hypothetical protein
LEDLATELVHVASPLALLFSFLFHPQDTNHALVC